MSSIGTAQYLFAEVQRIDVRGEPGFVSRLVFVMELELVPRHYDPSDSDRLLHAMSLTAIEGDLRLERGEDRPLVGALWPLCTLPLAQDRAARAATIKLYIDFGREQREALDAGDLVFVLRLRGAAEVWSNPLYDHDGDQKMRVGDRGLAEALQAIGCRESAPLVAWEERVVVSAERWRSLWSLA